MVHDVAIETVEDLRSHIALATKVELTTLAPYLYAMYSIQDQESDAARLIASVVVEEMLHTALTTNILLAIGGDPDFGYDAIPSFPSLLPHHTPDLPLSLRRCSRDLVRSVFMVIESPSPPMAEPEDDVYETLGQFYAALVQAIDRLDAEGDLFANHQPKRQLADPAFYGTVKFDAPDSGGLLLVHDRESADRALEIIVDQGEGLKDHLWADPAHQELTHFHKFLQIANGETALGPVWPLPDDPRTVDFPQALQPVSDLFNALYGLTFLTMARLFSGKRRQGSFVRRLYGLMSGAMAPVARYLVQQPISADHNAAPTFETYRFSGDPWVETSTLARAVARTHPALAEVAVRISTMRG